MSRYIIRVEGNSIQKRSIDNLVKDIQELKKDATVTVQRDEPPTSRSARFDAALAAVEEAKSEVESLRDELQEWYDNLPENFQNGDKGSVLTEAIDELETVISNMEDVTGASIEFPGMF